MTLAQVIARFHKDAKNAVDNDEAVVWANEIQTQLYDIDSQMWITATTFQSTDTITTITLTGIASNIRKIRKVYIDLTELTNSYSDDYEAKQIYQQKVIDFWSNQTYLYLRDDPDGEVLDIEYYRTPTALTTISSSLDFPARHSNIIYYGLMSMAAERKYALPSGDWEVMYHRKLEEIRRNEERKNMGASTVQPYSVI